MPADAKASWPEALDLLRHTLQILDRVDAPGDVRAHVDLVLHRFSESMKEPKPDPIQARAARNA